MSLNRYNPSSRYREKRAQKFANSLGVVAGLLIVLLIGFWLGKQYAAKNNIELTEEVAALTQERDLLRQSVTEITAEAQTSNMRYLQLQEEVDRALPDGPMKDLVALVREQLGRGMQPDRLRFAIQSARPPTDCKDLEFKNMLVSTPKYKGSDNAVVLNDVIKVSAKGISARSEKGKPEAWYDPAKELVVTFEFADKKQNKKGVLPIQHSVVHEGREYRMTIEESAKSYAKVIYDSCAFP